MDISHATPELFAALSKAQGEISNADKGSENPHYKSRYADLAEVLNTIRPVYAKHGLCLVQSTSFDGSQVYVTTLIGHATGGSISSTASCVPAKSDAQGIGSATTYLRRYGAAAAAGIGQEDLDGEDSKHDKKPEPKSAPKPVPKVTTISLEQEAILMSLVNESGSDLDQFCAFLTVKQLSDLPASRYGYAEQALMKKIDRLAGVSK